MVLSTTTRRCGPHEMKRSMSVCKNWKPAHRSDSVCFGKSGRVNSAYTARQLPFAPSDEVAQRLIDRGVELRFLIGLEHRTGFLAAAGVVILRSLRRPLLE